MREERWKEILNGVYAVSDQGRVKRLKAAAGANVGTILTPILPKMAYPYYGVRLSVCGKVVNARIHSLVTAAFIGPRPVDKCVNHIDGNKLNNCVENLEYVSLYENAQHASVTGLLLRGEEHSTAKLTDIQVIEIRQKYAEGATFRDLEKEYAVNLSTLHALVTGKTWKHLPTPNRVPRMKYARQAKVTENEVREIRRLYSEGASLVDLGRQFSLSPSTVHPLVHGKTWKHVK